VCVNCIQQIDKCPFCRVNFTNSIKQTINDITNERDLATALHNSSKYEIEQKKIEIQFLNDVNEWNVERMKEINNIVKQFGLKKLHKPSGKYF
jgi:5-methylcytosine-specific restriction endonuclease McrBC GTP-binding regulatory subunit McrB